MSLEFSLSSLALDNETKNVLKYILEDETLLRSIYYQPTNASDDVYVETLARPNITDKSLQERFNEFYLGLNGKESYVSNWANLDALTLRQHGYIFFFPDFISLSGSISPIAYNFDIYVPQSWHKNNNCLYVATRRLAEGIKNSRIFGDVGVVNGVSASPLFSQNKDGYCGMRLAFENRSFTENRINR